MLIPENISPDDCVYYNASFVLKILLRQGEIALPDLYCKVKRGRGMSYPMLVLCLDWLYLMGCIKADGEKVELFRG